ncbi:hypothetical protein [Nonomuraea lactucae]|nr:hypothetical protein [Nonomuraea lactucae]
MKVGDYPSASEDHDAVDHLEEVVGDETLDLPASFESRMNWSTT